MKPVNLLHLTVLATMLSIAPPAAHALQVHDHDHGPAQDEPPLPESDAQDQPGDTPSLDELLGLEEEADSAAETAREQQEQELQRRLAEKELTDEFRIALEKMSVSARLLDVQFDPGLGTQRVQEEILASLDRILDHAKKMQSQQMSSSSSSSSSQQQQQTPGQQQRQQTQSQSSQRQEGPTNSSPGDPPARQDGDLNTVIEESRTEWGSLPERIRQELYQGRREKFSSIYERLTREYYKRLAEESSSP